MDITAPDTEMHLRRAIFHLHYNVPTGDMERRAHSLDASVGPELVAQLCPLVVGRLHADALTDKDAENQETLRLWGGLLLQLHAAMKAGRWGCWGRWA